MLPERVVKQSAEGKEEEVEVKNKLTTEQYTVKVYTGDKFGAGTDANCYIRYMLHNATRVTLSVNRS